MYTHFVAGAAWCQLVFLVHRAPDFFSVLSALVFSGRQPVAPDPLSSESKRNTWTKQMGKAQPSPYEILGVAPNASRAEIRAAFFRAARLCHPDKQQQLQRLNDLNGCSLLSEDTNNLKPDPTNAVSDGKSSLPPDRQLDRSGLQSRNPDGATVSVPPDETVHSSRSQGNEKIGGKGRCLADGNAFSSTEAPTRDFIILKQAFDALQLPETRQEVNQALLRRELAHATRVRVSDLQRLDEEIYFFVCRCGEDVPISACELDTRRCPRRSKVPSRSTSDFDAESEDSKVPTSDAREDDVQSGHGLSCEVRGTGRTTPEGRVTCDSDGGKLDEKPRREEQSDGSKRDESGWRKMEKTRCHGAGIEDNVLVKVSCESCSLTICVVDD
ncbi:DnaJ domain-containing protein [Toxoplasma gondii TgCatPRC2]|uniref:DnaJ domain-containing protein n=4 Tax=Toxoplasma gondii TaxID=5811 RepID=A0A151HQI9_TOXGO|nr:DnaJ domain-containing protein [Toxoplasma gondii ME49]EPT26853.1 DnaJ domain-containing protein [Toxoplasma gondii ME49]KFG45860.1 DnaJ domain-containing protein [Toxoplasma gondii GAB2-2007-GAL-DOM2]KYF42270.1 DnaJ domain-containing protein [Toxoplasma gondii ARI]KYK71655.1 DnaJ domain-containing protein [Toxoplasma gondii TgCatPRC2]|eukprot:XP_002366028.2 DnaJ domain-containing protein [Toxoplasma gondii ME49]